ncbi:MAG: thermonuclease family protein [Alphaproteobacteria bacterium]|nr:thermonuclease family protein [Alphaproteobacteria bacterium]
MFLRLTLLIIGLAASYIGSMCFQGGSGADMAVGGGAILIGILCFFFLGKGLWRLLGCMTTFIIMAVVVGVLIFFLSGSDVINNLTAAVSSKISGTEEAGSADEQEDVEGQEDVEEQSPEHAGTNTTAQAPLDPQLLAGLPPGMMQQIQNAPQQMPTTLSGKITSIVSGDVFRMGQHTIRLYGLASPLIDQKCQDNVGHTYNCGYVAARMLKDFVKGDDVNCRIMNINAKNELMAACSVGTFDIGAAMVEAGWAIALPAVTQIYLPYQQKAQESRNGMWAGKFQMPWEWAAQQQQLKQRSSVKVDTPKLSAPRRVKKKSGGGGLGFLGGLF